MALAGALHMARLVGLRQLLARPRRSLLTVTGVAGGVALIFATASIDATLQASIATTVRGVAGQAQLEVTAPPSAAGLRPALVRDVARVPGVASTLSLRRSTARIASSTGTQRVLILGVPRNLGRAFGAGLGRAGRQLDALSGSELLLGPGTLGRPAAGTLRVETSAGPRAVRIAGRLGSVPFADLNGGAFALMDLGAAGSLFDRRGLVDAVYVLAEPGVKLSGLRERLRRQVAGRAFVGRPGSQSLPYERAYESLSQLTDLAVAGSLWVALFVVFNSMSMSLLERRRTISLASAIGATRRQIAAALLVEAALLGTVAALVGMAGGYLLADMLLDRSLEAYPLLPVTDGGELAVTSTAIVLAVVSGPLIAMLGALIPVRQMLSVSPREALRVEPAYEWSPAPGSGPAGRGRALLAGGGCMAAGIAGAASGAIVDVPWWVGGLAMAFVLTGALLLLPLVLPTLVRGARWLLARLFGVVGGLAGDSLLRNAGRTTITVGVLAFTAATAIGLGTALGSFESEMRSSFTARYGAPLYVTASSYSGITSDQPMPARVGGWLKRVEGVEAVYPLRYRPANVEGEQAVIASAPLGRQVRDGVQTAVDDTRASSRRSLMAGLGRGGVVPSRLTAERHDLDVGQVVRIPGPKGENRLRVVGIFDDVLSVDSVYMERSTYRRLSGDSTVDHFAIAPRSGTSLAALAGRLERSLAERRVNATVQTRTEVIDAILGNVRGMFSIARGLQIAALLIAGMVVANTMFTVVAERRWELALSRALGTTRTQVGAVVLLEALGIGLVGGAAAMLAGIALGVLMLTSMELRFSWTIDLQLQWALMSAVFAIGIAGALLAALLPAYSATRAPLAESLRSE